MEQMTPARQLADLALGESLSQRVSRDRAVGLSWRAISDALDEQTQGRVRISHETLRTWAAREGWLDTTKKAS